MVKGNRPFATARHRRAVDMPLQERRVAWLDCDASKLLGMLYTFRKFTPARIFTHLHEKDLGINGGGFLFCMSTKSLARHGSVFVVSD